jgi:hypothetical protein
MAVQDIRWKKHFWLVALLAIVLTQLACGEFDHLFYENDIVDYCEDTSSTYRFRTYRDCLNSVSVTCPDYSIPGQRDEACVDNWLNNNEPPADCTPFTISIPATMPRQSLSVGHPHRGWTTTPYLSLKRVGISTTVNSMRMRLQIHLKLARVQPISVLLFIPCLVMATLPVGLNAPSNGSPRSIVRSSA